MGNHSRVLVPLEAWSYSSPEVRLLGEEIDIGLMAEALIYYDHVLINPTNPVHFASLLRWFVQQRKYKEFLSLVNEGAIQIYDYGFITAAIRKDDTYSIWNMDDPVSQKPNSFEQRFLYHPSLNELFRNSRERISLYRAIRGNVIEAKATDFGPAIDNARSDYLDPKRSALVLQSLLDVTYPLLENRKPPDVTAEIETIGEKTRIHYNLNLDQVSQLLGPRLGFHLGMPLTALAICNRLIWSAAQLNLDLYLGSPMATLVGDKLYESQVKALKTENLIHQLNTEVEFPDIRRLVNQRKIGLDSILEIRKKSRKFREWLQQENDRDRNAIIAYHNEVAKEAGILSLGRKSLKLFGLLGGLAVDAYFSTQVAGFQGAITGSVAGAGIAYLSDVASKMGENWKPVVFGNWVRDRIEKVLREQNQASR